MKQLKLVLIIVFCLGFLNSSKASHMVGADITYKCLDAQGNYKVTLVYYRDCNGIPTCSGNCSAIGNCTKTLEVRGGDASYNGSLFFTATLTGVSIRDANYINKQICPNAKTICNNMGCTTTGSLSPGTERYEFEGVVNIGPGSIIPSGCCNVVFAFQECCRNGAITNISPQNFYTEARTNRCLATYPNCNSPIFSNDPYNVLCSGQPFFYNYGGYDPDFDSLTYELSPALYAFDDSATYNSPYTFTAPLPYTQPLNGSFPAGFKIDKDGNLQFKPSVSAFTGVVAVKANQWRKINNVYTRVGEVRRDIQIYIKFCTSNNPPWFITVPPGNPSDQPMVDYTITPDSPFCFTIVANDSDFNYPTVSDTTHLSWNNWLSKYGATFMPLYNQASRASNGPRQDSFSFCWRPKDSVVRNLPYQFSITGIDNKCPYSGLRSQMFNIKVIEGAKPIQINKTINCQDVSLSHGTPPVALSYKMWKVSRTPGFLDTSNMVTSSQQSFQLSLHRAGKYPFQLSVVESVSGLTRTFIDTIVIKREIKINNDTSFCGSNIPLNLRAFDLDSAFNKFRWYYLPNLVNVVDTHSTFNAVFSSNRSVLLRAYDSTGTCFYADTVVIKTGRIRASITMQTGSTQCFKNNLFKFKNTSVDTAGNPMSFLWSFSSGDTSTSKDSIVRSYQDTGMYQVKLLAYNALGCIDSTVQTIKVTPSPTAAFLLLSDSSQCLKGNVYDFANQSTVTGDSLSYTWKPGNGNVLNASNISVVYSSAGLYTVKLIATTSNQCKDSSIRQVKVQPQVKIGFTINDSTQCLDGNSYSFTDTSHLSAGTYTRNWSFGDSTNSTLNTPVHSFNIIGTYPVVFITTTDVGCKDTTYKNVYVLLKPVPAFTINDTSQCLTGNAFVFQNQSAIGNSDSLYFEWNFGDGTGSDSLHSTHTFLSTGLYTVKLHASSYAGCSDSLEKILRVNEVPAAQIDITDTMQCLGSNLFKPANLSSIGGGIMSYIWHMGDTISYTDSVVAHHYNKVGNFMVRLIVKSAFDCSDSTFKWVSVVPNPKSAFNILDSVDQCLAVNRFKFMNQTQNDSGSFTNLWSFGDGSFSTDTNPEYSYAAAGSFQVKLITGNSQHCNDSVIHTVQVYKTPQATFQMPDSTQCLGSLFVFNNTSVNTGDSIVDYIWSTGDSTIIHSKNTSYTYAAPGNYLAALVVVNQDSCYSIAKKQIEVYNIPKPLITGDTIAPQGSARTYTSPFSTGSVWNWMVSGDSLKSSSANSIQITWSSQDSGIVALTELDLNNCLSDTVYQTVQLTPLPVNVYEYASKTDRIMVYPQPASDKLFLLGAIETLQAGELLSMDGKLIYIFKSDEIQSGALDIQMIQSGMYLIQFTDNQNQVWVQKVSIVK
ncbi:MAG: PKD domain-containing protein [Bacteroidia bacterium]|jgi:PKD repeat protein